MLGSIKKSTEHIEALERVERWTRARFTLTPDTAVLVSEVACTLPGCPPRETVVAFWTADGKRYRFKLFKPVAEVVHDDLPIAWLLQTLIDDGDSVECC